MVRGELTEAGQEVPLSGLNRSSRHTPKRIKSPTPSASTPMKPLLGQPFHRTATLSMIPQDPRLSSPDRTNPDVAMACATKARTNPAPAIASITPPPWLLSLLLLPNHPLNAPTLHPPREIAMPTIFVFGTIPRKFVAPLRLVRVRAAPPTMSAAPVNAAAMASASRPPAVR